MAASTTFPDIIPDRKSKRNYQPRTLKADFGDGYHQATADGVNPYVESWDLSFENYPQADVDTIVAFLEARGEHDPFYWTPPLETALTPNPKQWVLVGKISRTFPGAKNNSVKFKIKRVFAL